MTIKDFKPGKTVYSLRRTHGRTTEHFIKKCIVIRVGRKYVYAVPEGNEYATGYFLNEESDNYLTENKDWGDRERLFLTEQDVNDDIELDMLRGWIRKATDSYRLTAYTLGQLRAVKEILEGHGNE